RFVAKTDFHGRQATSPWWKNDIPRICSQLETFTVDLRRQSVEKQFAFAREIRFEARISRLRFNPTFLNLLKSRNLSHIDQILHFNFGGASTEGTVQIA